MKWISVYFFFLVSPGHYVLNTCYLLFWTCWSCTEESVPLCFSSFKAASQLLFEEELKIQLNFQRTCRGLGVPGNHPCHLDCTSYFLSRLMKKRRCHTVMQVHVYQHRLYQAYVSFGDQAASHTLPEELLHAKFVRLHVNSWQLHVLIMITKLPARLLQESDSHMPSGSCRGQSMLFCIWLKIYG